jgi:hypothetical protein
MPCRSPAAGNLSNAMPITTMEKEMTLRMPCGYIALRRTLSDNVHGCSSHPLKEGAAWIMFRPSRLYLCFVEYGPDSIGCGCPRVLWLLHLVVAAYSRPTSTTIVTLSPSLSVRMLCLHVDAFLVSSLAAPPWSGWRLFLLGLLSLIR